MLKENKRICKFPPTQPCKFTLWRTQANIAINIADVIIFLTDVTQGVTAADEEIALMLRKSKKKVVLVCNKADNFGKTTDDIYEFYSIEIFSLARLVVFNSR